MGKGTNFSGQPVLSQLIKLRVMQTKAKSKLAFSNIVMLTRATLGAYIDLVTLLNCPKLDWNLLELQRARWLASQNIQQLELFPT